MAKCLYILNGPPYGDERSYNGLRLADSLAKREGYEVRFFRIGDAVACAKRGQNTPQGFYNLERMLQLLLEGRGQVGVCGSCLNALRHSRDGTYRGLPSQQQGTTGEMDDSRRPDARVLARNGRAPRAE